MNEEVTNVKIRRFKEEDAEIVSRLITKKFFGSQQQGLWSESYGKTGSKP